MREALVIGVGCTRGTPAAVLLAGIDAVLARHALRREAVCAIASIDRKRDEHGLLELARAQGWPLSLYDAAALAQLAPERASAVVLERVGAPGVAEPAARLCAGRGPLRVPKTIIAAGGHAMTIAVAALRGPRDDG